MSKKQAEFADRIERLRAAEQREAELKASNRTKESIIPEGLQVKVKPTPPTLANRFYVDPASLEPGQFSSMKPGQYAFEPASCAARAA